MKFNEARWVKLCRRGLLFIACVIFGPCHAMTLHAVFDGWLGSSSHVLDDDGMLWCWGRNAAGQLGDGTTNASVNAVKIALPEGVSHWKHFEAGAAFALLDDQQRLYAWGQVEGPGLQLGPTQKSPIRLTDFRWKKVVVPSFRSGLDAVPWGLGITDSGELRWIRIRKPLASGDAPFANLAIETVQGIDGALKFRDVVAGRHMFLALADSGELFACGVGYWGVLGPNGDPESTKFLTPFVSVPAPVGSGGWKRIGQADTQSFGWTETGELYVWGRRFKSADVLDWEWVTDPVPRVVPKAPNGSPWVEVSGFGEAQPETLLQNAAGELWLTGDGLAITVGGKLQSVPAGGSPVSAFSKGGRHTLYLGSDGLVRAIGNNEDFQLGGFPGGELFEFPPVIPGGEAPFLLGKPAEVPTLQLEATQSVMTEPTTVSGGPEAAVSFLLNRTGRMDVGVIAQLEYGLRKADGAPILQPEAGELLQEILDTPNFQSVVLPGTTQNTHSLVPRRALNRDEDLWIDVRLMPHPSYAIAGGSTLTFQYKHTVPTTYPPEITIVWPPPSRALYIGEYLGVIFRVVDRDGSAVVANFIGTDFSPFPDGFPRSMPLERVVPGAEKSYELRIPRKSFLGALGPELRIEVRDDTGERTTVDLGVLRSQVTGLHKLDVQTHRGVQRLTIGSVLTHVALESSEDLTTWNVEATYKFPTPGFPQAPVELGASNAARRYFRLKNVP